MRVLDEHAQAQPEGPSRRFVQKVKEDLQVWHVRLTSGSTGGCSSCGNTNALLTQAQTQAQTSVDDQSTVRALLPEEVLLKADQKEHAHRSVSRILVASTPFTYDDDTPKKDSLHDYQMLLGSNFHASEFPAFGGRLYIAGKLA